MNSAKPSCILPKFNIIAAVDEDWGIAKNGAIPWHGTPVGSADLQFFKDKTSGGAVIMGRKTWETLKKPLPGRINIVLSRQIAGIVVQDALTNTPVVFMNDFNNALNYACTYRPQTDPDSSNIFVIGGEQIYETALRHPRLAAAYISRIPASCDCDTLFPKHLLPARYCSGIYNSWQHQIQLNFHIYEFINVEELQYHDLVETLLYQPLRPNRTNIQTRSTFHKTLYFKLSDERGRVLPLLTTKKVFWKPIYHELIWFLRGSTDTTYLRENNVKIWDGNSSREFLDKLGMNNAPEGHVGPIYGKQWREWSHHDQIAEVIENIKKDPFSRRHVVSAWNVADLEQMVLAPCHYSFQFYIEADKGRPSHLNCLVNMRSADIFLGVPFNIASYALLTHMISHLTNLAPGILAISMADCHLYENAENAAKLLLKRTPLRFPTLKFSQNIGSNATIDDFAHKFTIDDYVVENYESYSAIKAAMAV